MLPCTCICACHVSALATHVSYTCLQGQFSTPGGVHGLGVRVRVQVQVRGVSEAIGPRISGRATPPVLACADRVELGRLDQHVGCVRNQCAPEKAFGCVVLGAPSGWLEALQVTDKTTMQHKSMRKELNGSPSAEPGWKLEGTSAPLQQNQGGNLKARQHHHGNGGTAATYPDIHGLPQ